jgi:hypothetical protein
VGGAILVKDLLDLLGSVGFGDVEFVRTTGMTTSKFTEGALFRARAAK